MNTNKHSSGHVNFAFRISFCLFHFPCLTFILWNWRLNTNNVNILPYFPCFSRATDNIQGKTKAYHVRVFSFKSNCLSRLIVTVIWWNHIGPENWRNWEAHLSYAANQSQKKSTYICNLSNHMLYRAPIMAKSDCDLSLRGVWWVIILILAFVWICK